MFYVQVGYGQLLRVPPGLFFLTLAGKGDNHESILTISVADP
jgi:hypothetical protein